VNKTLRQRQADWRGRRDLRSAFFEVLNDERLRKLKLNTPDDDRPEMRAIVDFFLAYPRCHNWPDKLELRNGVWYIRCASGADYLEEAAAFVALSQITSLPIVIGLAPLPPRAIDLVKQEVAELRRLNMWGGA
jgi:hypothetical protein